MTKTTDQLMGEIQRKGGMAQFLEENRQELLIQPLHVLLSRYLEEHGLEKSEVILKSHLDRGYAYHVFSGAKQNPSRNVLLALALAMGLNLDEVQMLLRVAHHAMLYPRVRRDALLIYAVSNQYSVFQCTQI